MTNKHFTLYTGADAAPNPWKVVQILYELGFTEEESINFHILKTSKQEHKAPEYTRLNPNGRLPALIDHRNNDLVIWESGAIIQYLVDKYDTERKISFVDEADKYHAIQWLMFQMSGQGPYFGQAFWFSYYHSEKIPSAVNRYVNEIHRVLSVLEDALSKSPSHTLVGDKISYADIAFLVWMGGAAMFTSQDPTIERPLEKWHDEYPTVAGWVKTLEERPAVKAARAKQAEVIAAAKADA